MIDVKGTPSTRPGARPSLGCRLMLSWVRMYVSQLSVLRQIHFIKKLIRKAFERQFIF